MLDSALTGGVIGATVAAVIMIVVFLANRNKTGAEYLQKMPRRILRFATPTPPDQVLAALAGGIPEAKAVPSVTDPNLKRLVLMSPMTIWTWGFHYPIHIAALPEGGSQVDVGIASRAFQWGPLVARAHENFVAMVQARVGATAPAQG